MIDTTILKSDGHYYRISKDETNKCLILETADSLTEGFTRIDSSILADLVGVEGPEGYLLPDEKTWCLIADQFMTGKGYLPSTSPTGPFAAMDEPMVTIDMMKKNGIRMSQTIDSSIYQEDGEYYLLFSNGGSCDCKAGTGYGTYRGRYAPQH